MQKNMRWLPTQIMSLVLDLHRFCDTHNTLLCHAYRSHCHGAIVFLMGRTNGYRNSLGLEPTHVATKLTVHRVLIPKANNFSIYTHPLLLFELQSVTGRQADIKTYSLSLSLTHIIIIIIIIICICVGI
jgi:hypothetical protein